MTHGSPANLADQDWFVASAVAQVFALLGADDERTRIVGGAVRDALLHRVVREIDFATVLRPEQVMERAAAAGLKAIPTGIEFGTVTLVVDEMAFEVTTLREDVETDGRRAVVAFGRDWVADARRRDFTMNTLSVDSAGHVYDPVGGYDDLQNGVVRFVGNPGRRIAEDRLRILRLFRFHAAYGRGPIPSDDLAAAVRARHQIRALSAERVGREMGRLMVAPRAAETAALMQESGVLPVVLGGVGYVAMLARVMALEESAGGPLGRIVRLTALTARIGEDAARVAHRLRLSRAEREAMVRAVYAAHALLGASGRSACRKLLYRTGAQAFADGVALAYAWSGQAGHEPWLSMLKMPDVDPVPAFPLSGRDVMALGIPSGRDIGAFLSNLENWWIEQDFAPDREALRARLAQMVSGSQ